MQRESNARVRTMAVYIWISVELSNSGAVPVRLPSASIIWSGSLMAGGLPWGLGVIICGRSELLAVFCSAIMANLLHSF